MTYFPLYPYHTDPLRILAPHTNRPAGTECAGPATAEAPLGAVPPAGEDAESSPAPAAQPPPPPAAAAGEGDPRPPARRGLATESPEPASVGDDDDADHTPPDPEADLHAWLVDNWDVLKALEAAGRLPALAPPGADEGDAPEPEPDPVPRETEPPLLHVRRGDRWTKPKMADFLRQLAATHSIAAAARSVGMSRQSAYRLRNRLKGQPFDIAWEAAFRHGYDNLAHAALDRAINGVEVPHYCNGELVGTSRRFDERLTVALLASRNRAGAPMLGRYGAAAEYWGEHWDELLERVETGSVDWSDERAALDKDEPRRRELPTPEREVELLIERNRPDGPPARGRAR